MQITLTELRRTPASALDEVRAGNEVIVTEAGIPLCRLVPIGRPSRYSQLVASGAIKPPTAPHDFRKIRERALAGWNSGEA